MKIIFNTLNQTKNRFFNEINKTNSTDFVREILNDEGFDSFILFENSEETTNIAFTNMFTFLDKIFKS